MTLLRKTATAVALSFASLGAVAQGAYHCATVKLISPSPPGGTTDILARQWIVREACRQSRAWSPRASARNWAPR